MGIALESEHVYSALGDKDIALYKRELKFYQELRASVKLRYSDSLDFKEYEAKMRNLMDTYIAAEDIIIITAPTDIMNEDEFESELMRLGSPRAKADAIRTRVSKRINQKWDEDPSFYKKFSQRIEEILSEYMEKRISDADYLKRMHTVMKDFRKGNSGVVYPETIKHNVDAQAFYGVVKEVMEADGFYTTTTDQTNESEVIYIIEEIMAAVAADIDVVVDRHCKVDWHDNPDVHKNISYNLLDILYSMKTDYYPSMSYELIDKIIENIMTVALRRY